NAINLLGPEGPIVDLHRRLSSLQPDPALTAWFLERSTPWAPAPAGLCKPAPEALLLHLCERARSSRRDPERGRWLADLPWIVRHPDLDWPRLTQATQRFSLVDITQRSARLCAEIGQPWPEPITALMALQADAREQALLRFLRQNGSFASLPLRLWSVWISAAREDTSTLQRLAHFPRALLRETGSPGWWNLIARGLTRSFRIRAAQREFDAARARQQVESQLRLERLLAERHQQRSRNTSR
nr:nucleotidyltransferase family protein [Xanthomonadales bacterium]